MVIFTWGLKIGWKDEEIMNGNSGVEHADRMMRQP